MIAGRIDVHLPQGLTDEWENFQGQAIAPHPLGQALVAAGLLTPEQLAASLIEQQSGLHLEQIWINQGWIQAKTLAYFTEHLVSPDWQAQQESPGLALMQMITGMWVTQSIYVAASLGIADLIQAGVYRVEDLARVTETQAPHLYRVLRALASVGIFTEVAPQEFGLTPIAEYLRSDVPGSLRALSRTVSDRWQWDCWGDILNIVKTGQPAMQRLYQVQDTFTYLTQHPESGAIFDDAMTGWAKTIHTAVIDCYDFSGFRTLVDIAGGHGLLLASILAANPNLQGILFDLPQVVAGANQLLEQAQVASRCRIEGGSFFATIPRGGDAYLMSHILHDWGDQDCIRILQGIRQSITPQGKLLIVEMVIPEGDTPHFGKFLDVDMMAIFAGGRERTASEYHSLFQAAGFKLNRIIPTATPVSVIEGICV